MTIQELQAMLDEFPPTYDIITIVASETTDEREVGDIIDVSLLGISSVRLLIHIG